MGSRLVLGLCLGLGFGRDIIQALAMLQALTMLQALAMLQILAMLQALAMLHAHRPKNIMPSVAPPVTDENPPMKLE